jgi:transcription initiation factor TFIID subunit 13
VPDFSQELCRLLSLHAAMDQTDREDDGDLLDRYQCPSEGAVKRKRKTAMQNDIEEMMYGFGDQWPPKEESVDLIENVVTKYIEDLAYRAKEVSDLRGKLDKECFMYVVRKDRSKFSRVCHLLAANEELKNAQKMELKES